MIVEWATGVAVNRAALEMLRAAFEPGMADDTWGDLERDVLEGRSLLWTASENGTVYGTATTKVVVYPNRRRVCVITACAGYKYAAWQDALREIELYATQMGCTAVRLSGRKGWAILKKGGYKEPWIMLEKEL